MTYEEYCEIMDNSNFMIDSSNSYDMKIQEALEKQTPKKLIVNDFDGFSMAYCPNCHGGFGEVKPTKSYLLLIMQSFYKGEMFGNKCACPHCGQAIDFNEVE